jgi:hypothetical protein
MEFQKASAPAFNEPLREPSLPSFQERLRLIRKQILQYQHMYPVSPQVLARVQALPEK